MKTTKTITTRCPSCYSKLDAATSMGDFKPNVGDCSVCIVCSELLRYREGLKLEKLTKQDWEEIGDDTITELRKAQNVVINIKKGNHGN